MRKENPKRLANKKYTCRHNPQDLNPHFQRRVNVNSLNSASTICFPSSKFFSKSLALYSLVNQLTSSFTAEFESSDPLLKCATLLTVLNRFHPTMNLKKYYISCKIIYKLFHFQKSISYFEDSRHPLFNLLTSFLT